MQPAVDYRRIDGEERIKELFLGGLRNDSTKKEEDLAAPIWIVLRHDIHSVRTGEV